MEMGHIESASQILMAKGSHGGPVKIQMLVLLGLCWVLGFCISANSRAILMFLVPR